jgi:hypothetical protein
MGGSAMGGTLARTLAPARLLQRFFVRIARGGRRGGLGRGRLGRRRCALEGRLRRRRHLARRQDLRARRHARGLVGEAGAAVGQAVPDQLGRGRRGADAIPRSVRRARRARTPPGADFRQLGPAKNPAASRRQHTFAPDDALSALL